MILGAVCARGGSRGVPGKALRRLKGRSLIAIAVDCALRCGDLDAVTVSTDDRTVAEEAHQHGADVPFLRPGRLAESRTPKWLVFRHLVDEWEKRHACKVEILVDLDVSVPLRIPEDISRCIHTLTRGEADVVMTAFKPVRNPYFNMVECDPGHGCRIVKQPPDPVHNRQEAPTVYGLSPAVYAIRRRALDAFEHWSLASMDVVEIPRTRAWDIDEDIDFKIVEMLSTYGANGNEGSQTEKHV